MPSSVFPMVRDVRSSVEGENLFRGPPQWFLDASQAPHFLVTFRIGPIHPLFFPPKQEKNTPPMLPLHYLFTSSNTQDFPARLFLSNAKKQGSLSVACCSNLVREFDFLPHFPFLLSPKTICSPQTVGLSQRPSGKLSANLGLLLRSLPYSQRSLLPNLGAFLIVPPHQQILFPRSLLPSKAFLRLFPAGLGFLSNGRKVLPPFCHACTRTIPVSIGTMDKDGSGITS